MPKNYTINSDNIPYTINSETSNINNGLSNGPNIAINYNRGTGPTGHTGDTGIG